MELVTTYQTTRSHNPRLPPASSPKTLLVAPYCGQVRCNGAMRAYLLLIGTCTPAYRFGAWAGPGFVDEAVSLFVTLLFNDAVSIQTI
jgi:hypothetical protein